MISQWLSERLGQPFNVDNRLGASSSVATEATVKLPADGYMPLLAVAVNAVNATLYERVNIDFFRVIASVASLIRSPNLIVVNLAVPEFIVYAKANPGKSTWRRRGIEDIICGNRFERGRPREALK